MKRIITPAIFLAASIVAGTQDAAPSASEIEELACDNSDREAPKSDEAHVHFGSAA